MANFKKKPTIKEVANVTIELSKKVNELYFILKVERNTQEECMNNRCII